MRVCGDHVLDAFQGRDSWFDFLCPKSEAGEFRQEFAGRGEVEPSHAQIGCGGGIFSYVVDVQGFLGGGIYFAQRVVIDRGSRLAYSDPAGIDACRKMADKWKRGFDMCNVDGVRVRKQGQATARCETFKQRFRQNGHRFKHAVPILAEFLEAQ